MVYALVVRLRDAPGGATNTRARSGSTRRTGSASAAGIATRCWGSSSRWNACCGSRTRSCPRSSRCWTSEDPWVRALARLQVGKMRIMLGQGGRDADAYLEMALARVPGARRTVRDLVRPDRAGGPARHARRVRRCVRALRAGDRGRHRGRRRRGRHPDADAAGAAVLAARRRGRQRGRHRRGRAAAPRGSPGRTRWPTWRSRRRSSPAGAATPRRPAGSSASRRPCWATTRSRRTSARRSTTCSATWPTISARPVRTASRPGRRRPRRGTRP